MTGPSGWFQIIQLMSMKTKTIILDEKRKENEKITYIFWLKV